MEEVVEKRLKAMLQCSKVQQFLTFLKKANQILVNIFTDSALESKQISRKIIFFFFKGEYSGKETKQDLIENLFFR